MTLPRALIFVAFSLVIGLGTLMFAGFSTMGDCFEVATCASHKRQAAFTVLGGGFVLWFIGAIALIRRWSP